MADPSPFEDFEEEAGAFGAEPAAAAGDEFDFDGEVAAPADAAAADADAADEEDPFGLGADEDGAADEDDDDAEEVEAFAAAPADDAADEEDPFGEAAGGLGEAGAGQAAPELLQEQEEEKDTPLSQWKEERAKVLAARVAAAEENRAAAAQTAQDEIAKFYEQRAETLAKTQAAHRNDEKNAKEEMQSLMANGTPWEKVAKQVDLKPGKNGDAGTARMRKLLLQLKQDK